MDAKVCAAMIAMSLNLTPVQTGFATLAFKTAEAQIITFDGCVDSRGIRVASVLRPGLGDVAKSTLDSKGRPVILYDPMVLSWFHPQTRLFWYAHECAHHALGHLIGSTFPLLVEEEADCWGIKTLYKRGILSDADVKVVEHDISKLPFSDWMHLPGPLRAINLKLCLALS